MEVCAKLKLKEETSRPLNAVVVIVSERFFVFVVVFCFQVYSFFTI